MKLKLFLFIPFLISLIAVTCVFARPGAQLRQLEGQELEVLAIKWKPGPEPLNFKKQFDIKLADKDFMQLEALGLTGQLTLGGSGVFGRGTDVHIAKQARVLLLIKQQLKEPVDLLQPDGVEVIYVQGDDGWQMYPKDAPDLKKSHSS